MKRVIALLLALVLSLSLVACGGPDVQPAIDAYNKLAENYNTFVEQENENLDSWAEEDVEYMNEIAAVITEYGTKLSGDTEFTQEQIDEMVGMFNEFNAVIEEYLKG
jgi:ABC-type glycerol-3-phosphate transport system substrate-binding protein